MTAFHSLRVDRLIGPMDICRSAAKAVDELIAALEIDDVHGIIAAERRLVAVGALAQTNANRLERETTVVFVATLSRLEQTEVDA